MNILIACDSFKDALNAKDVCLAIERGLKLANLDFDTRIFPLADGGEGVKDILDFHLDLETKTVEVNDPLFRKIGARYSRDKASLVSTVFIEMAQAAGLQLLKNEERNSLKTSTFGVGEMISDAIKNGAKRIILGIGGSATNDLGIGMAAALGWKFLDHNKNELIPIGENLIRVEFVIPPEKNVLKNIDFEVMCDVTNPLLGKKGTAQTYAKQKGATEKDIQLLEMGAEHFLNVVNDSELAEISGAGAAGGLGFGSLFFLNATIKSGISAIMDLTEFDKQVDWADIIITGEGQLDTQTAQGKLISGILTRSNKKPVIAFVGSMNLSLKNLTEFGLKAAFSINPFLTTLDVALKNTEENLEKLAFNVGRLLV